MSKFSAKGPSQRQLRVGENVRHALTQLIQRGEVQDDRLQSAVISISEVSMSPDLKIATAYVSPLGGGDAKPIIKALAENAKFIRGRLSPYLNQMKYMPEFRFREDTSFDNYSKIDTLLHSEAVQRDLKGSDDND
ncbi:MAG: 30S ribosome-binding factor RbfA [Pseudomonadota bacterium]